ncbi:DNA polymerase III subunit epsilon [Brucella pseudogrignonensis]|jgi:exodeoxyribonuclease X|uniref:exonuclease domain-containing protein n=1 Tax=Brucella TaxID=234 RepID=UPI000DDCAF12|nr:MULTISPECIES: exonuclease domain-containing protein [Brucella]MBK0022557.1 DNA polymerase III subunit epsilon [Ochrobactrum sp. S45]MBK0044572.1 DNA polymerase III subunit epsilon [Ochrobactrum sp. S46]UKK95506.1 DNA polymerase III subunit epsilon [Brucella pseudogrignonensis]
MTGTKHTGNKHTGTKHTGAPNASQRIRVIDLETAGNGSNEVCEIGWQDVALDGDGHWALTEQSGARFVNPGRAISAETMAVHHILDAQVADAPLWKEIAPLILRNAAVGALAAHRATFEQRYCRPQLTGGLPWICTWKCALRLWPELPRFSNQMLRYQRMPEGLVHALGLPAHRALPDAYVTAHHLRDMLNAASLKQLLAWSAEPGLLPRVKSGPDRGKGWDRISVEALNAFVQDRDPDIRFSATTELIRRGQLPVPENLEPQQGSLL